jgi:hypothetical protein
MFSKTLVKAIPWKQEVIDKDLVDRISGAIQYDISIINTVPDISRSF